MENKIEFEFKGKLPESCFNELVEFIYDKGGCLQNFPIPFCGVHIDKATCLKCIGDALKLPQARVSGSLPNFDENLIGGNCPNCGHRSCLCYKSLGFGNDH